MIDDRSWRTWAKSQIIGSPRVRFSNDRDRKQGRSFDNNKNQKIVIVWESRSNSTSLQLLHNIQYNTMLINEKLRTRTIIQKFQYFVVCSSDYYYYYYYTSFFAIFCEIAILVVLVVGGGVSYLICPAVFFFCSSSCMIWVIIKKEELY